MSASSIDGLHRITVKKEPPIATKKKVAPGKPTVALSNKGKLGIFKALRYIAIVCLVIFLAVVAWFIYNMYPVDKNDTAPREVTIVSGLSHVDVANQLKSANLIRNAWAFDRN